MRDLGTMLAHMLGADPATTRERITTLVEALTFAEGVAVALGRYRSRLRVTGVEVEVMRHGPMALERGDRYNGRLRSKGIRDALRANLDDYSPPVRLLFAEVFIPGQPALEIEVGAEGDLYAAFVNKQGEATVVESGLVSDYADVEPFLEYVLSPILPALRVVKSEGDEQ